MSNFKILVVDDDVRIRTSLKVLLKNKYKIVPDLAKNGEDALEKIHKVKGDYDLIITDNQMGEISGLDIVAEVNERYPDLKVIMMTAHANFQISIPKIKNTLFDFLEKPFENDKFVEVIDRFIEENHKEENVKKLVELGQMTGAIIHEINNPLGVLMMKSFQMKQAVENKAIEINDNKDFEDGLTVMERTINQLAATVNATKAAYSQNNHKTFKPFTLQQALKDLDDFYGVKFKSYVRVSVDDKYLGLVINGNKDQIVQSLYNLMKNAQQEVSSQEDPWVELSVSKPHDGQVILSVTDSGNGIPLELQTMIFSSFYTSKDADKGTGLGLSIVKRVVESHSGLIQVDGNCANTKFDVILPVNEDNASAPALTKVA